MNKLVAEILGWYGVFAILAAYALVSFSVVQAGSPAYQILNLTGGGSIAVISVVKRVFQPATLNIIWAVIALVALVRLFV